MPTATAARPTKRTRASTKPEVETEVETEVVVDPKLNSLIEKWDKSKGAANQSWMQLAKYVRDHEITRTQLKYALVEIQGMKESSAVVACSRLLRFQKSQEASEMLDRALDGEEDITAADLMGANVFKGEKKDKDPSETMERKLTTVASFAIEKAGIEDVGEYIVLAKRTYRCKPPSPRREAKASGNGER
jgi:hypothetical protein